ncbi:MAG TPA: nuclear transport factor 2 family protein [Acidobacteriota bacterium]|jgi:ketosteroid isomerase-like protein
MAENRGPIQPPEDLVLAVNEAFYQALQSLDIEAMEAVWLHKEWVYCVHPGWQAISGWDQVRQSWEAIFANTENLTIRLHQITLQICGLVAWLTCTEEINSGSGEETQASLAQSTNIYMKVGDEWKLVHHHASPVPASTFTEETIQ